MDLEKTIFNPKVLIIETIQAIKYKADEKGVNIIFDESIHLQEYAVGDPTRIRQIIINLLGNAIKFTAKGSITIHPSITETLPNNNKLLFTCSITDTGIGIPKDRQHKLFKLFSQVDASTTRQYGGTGLGLSIVNTLCALMGGDVHVESEENKGSKFTFSITLLKPKQKKVLQPSQESLVNNQYAKKSSLKETNSQNKKVLIVEDNRVNTLVVLDALSALPCITAETAEDGNHAIAILKKSSNSPFDLILMDCQMPIKDGYETTKDIRSGHAGKHCKEIPIIAMTANAMKGDKEKCVNTGMNDYISKPFEIDDLKAIIYKWI